MGGCAIYSDSEFTPIPTSVQTVILVGKTGNGKSATGNSILGRVAFSSNFSFSGVTNTCELQTARLSDDHEVNVMDTPGLFDSSSKTAFASKEIVKCMDLAKDGIHAVILVFSIRTRFSVEEKTVLPRLQMLFGEKIVKYMIVVFTGGDEFEDSGLTFDDYLDKECPEPLQKVIGLCKNRVVVFDNKTKDQWKKNCQVEKLFSLVKNVLEQNDGCPFTNELFLEFKMENAQNEDLFEHHLKQMTEYVESKLKESNEKLEKLEMDYQTKMEDQKMDLEKQIAAVREANGKCSIL